MFTVESSSFLLLPLLFVPPPPSSFSYNRVSFGHKWPLAAPVFGMEAASATGYFLRFTLCHCVCLSAYVCTMYMQMSSEAREGIRSLGAGAVTAGCELPNVSAGSQNPRALQEPQALFTPEHLCSLLFCPLQFILLPSHRVKAALRLTHCAANPPASASQVCNLRCVLQCPIRRHFFGRK